MAVRKSKKIGLVFNCKVLDSKHIGKQTKFLLECPKCGYQMWSSKHVTKCPHCGGGRHQHNAKGYSNEPLHKEYTSILRRLRGHEFYKHVPFFDEWREDYTKFREWALSHGYKQGLTIDRIDNSKGYEPSNCRWATAKEQANNKTNNVRITYNGMTKTMSEWADFLEMPYNVIQQRHKRKWSIEDILLTPYKSRFKYSELK